MKTAEGRFVIASNGGIYNCRAPAAEHIGTLFARRSAGQQIHASNAVANLELHDLGEYVQYAVYRSMRWLNVLHTEFIFSSRRMPD